MTEEEIKLLEEMTFDLAKQLDEDDKVDKLKGNERAKYLAASFDRFSTGGFLASLIAAGFAITTNWSTWTSVVFDIYIGLCILWFLVAAFLHWLGRVVLAKGLR